MSLLVAFTLMPQSHHKRKSLKNQIIKRSDAGYSSTGSPNNVAEEAL